MYTPSNARLRFGKQIGNDHFVCVEYTVANGWALVNGPNLRFPFQPESTDLLVAKADMAWKTVEPLVSVSQRSAVYGIATSYIYGDLTFAYGTCDGEELVCVCVCVHLYICMESDVCVWYMRW